MFADLYKSKAVGPQHLIQLTYPRFLQHATQDHPTNNSCGNR